MMSSSPREGVVVCHKHVEILHADGAVVRRVERLAAQRVVEGVKTAAPRLVAELLTPFQRSGHLVDEMLRPAPEDQHVIAKAVDRRGIVFAA